MAPVYQALKRLLVGRPLSSAESEHQRLTKKIALAVFSSDAISSTAYATEEILRILVPVGGLLALNDLIPIAIVVVVLLAIVAFSYRQTIFAYPNGGGSYIVSRENLGITPSLVAGASLLTDYIVDGVGVGGRRRGRHHVGLSQPARATPCRCACSSWR